MMVWKMISLFKQVIFSGYSRSFPGRAYVSIAVRFPGVHTSQSHYCQFFKRALRVKWWVRPAYRNDGIKRKNILQNGPRPVMNRAITPLEPK